MFRSGYRVLATLLILTFSLGWASATQAQSAGEQPSLYPQSGAPGTRFTFLSDGVIEAANPRGELFGFDRTAAISTKPAKEIAAAAKAWGQNDDITVVTVRRLA